MKHFGECPLNVNSVCCSVSAASRGYVVFVQIKAWRSWHRKAYAVYVQWILSKMALGWRGGDELSNKVVVFVFFVYKKYYRSFIILWLNPWCHMDYFTDVLATFLDINRVNYIAVYGRVRELSEFIKNILICFLKMNKGVTGLERHEGE